MTPLFAIAALASAPAEPGRYWDPGNPTTSSVKGEVRADEAEAGIDGVYGRFERAFDLGTYAGAEVDGSGAAGAVRASLHYYSMAGIYAGYADAFGGDAISGSRLVSLGVDARPAFIPRWSKNWEQGSGFFDLTLDSISIGLGGYFGAPRDGSFGDRRGFEMSLGFGVPLSGKAAGPWLGARSLFRWDDRPSGDGVMISLLAALGWQVSIGE